MHSASTLAGMDVHLPPVAPPPLHAGRPPLPLLGRVRVLVARDGADHELPLLPGPREEVVVGRHEGVRRVGPEAVLLVHALADLRVRRADARLRPAVEVVEAREAAHEGAVHDELGVDVRLHVRGRPHRLPQLALPERRHPLHVRGEQVHGLAELRRGHALEAAQGVRERPRPQAPGEEAAQLQGVSPLHALPAHPLGVVQHLLERGPVDAAASVVDDLVQGRVELGVLLGAAEGGARLLLAEDAVAVGVDGGEDVLDELVVVGGLVEGLDRARAVDAGRVLGKEGGYNRVGRESLETNQ